MFSADLIDREGGETRAAFFGIAVDTFFDLLQEKKTYVFGGGRVKKADPKWCKFQWEITFDQTAQISESPDDGICPQLVFNLQPLSALQDLKAGDHTDVAGIVIEGDQPMEVPLKAGGSKKRANWTLLDDSGVTCRLTLWGEFSELPWQEGSVVLIKAAKISEFGGRSLNNGFASSLRLDDEARACHPRAQELLSWYAAKGAVAKSEARPLSNERGGGGGPPQTIAEVKTEANLLQPPLGGDFGQSTVAPGGVPKNPGVGYHTVLPVTVTFLSHDRQPFYMSCPVEVPDDRAGEGKMRACNRKVELNGSGSGWCCSADHCCTEPKPRWILNFSIADHSGSQFVSVFDEMGAKVLSCEAAEAARLWEMKEADSGAAFQFEQLFKRAQYKRWRMRLRSKKEVWNDEERVKVEALECDAVAYSSDARSKLKEVLASLGAPAATPGGV